MLPHTITIETERLLLKELTPELYAHIFSNWEVSDIMQYLGHATTADYELELEKHTQGLTVFDLQFRYLAMYEKQQGKVIGRIGYHTWKPLHRRAEIGYGLYSDDYKNKGYMKEAILPALQYGFKQMNLNRIEAFASPNNIPSVRLLENNGFVREGLLRQHYHKNGIMENSAVFGLLKEEFELLHNSKS